MGLLSAEIIGSTFYSQLNSIQRDAIRNGTANEDRIIEVALEQIPPNEGVIAAIHVSTQSRRLNQRNRPATYLRRDPVELGEIYKKAESALESIAAHQVS